jgi:hypothetical protein
LRFWIQTFFELLTAASYGIGYSLQKNPTQDVDFFFCLLFLVFYMQAAYIFCLVLFIYLLKARAKLTNNEEIKDFMIKYGTFFEEFKGDGVKMWMFYVLFLLRRLFLVFSIFFLPYGTLQLTVSISFSLTVNYIQIALYILAFKSFKENLYNYYHFFNELLLAGFFSVILVGFIHGEENSSNNLSNVCMWIITGAWILNIAVSITDGIKTLHNYLKKLIEKCSKRKHEGKYRMTTVPEIDRTFDKTVDISLNSKII